ncbi:MAG: hypothetical protein ACFFD2_12165 [Promethearchaeota archaeon]
MSELLNNLETIIVRIDLCNAEEMVYSGIQEIMKEIGRDAFVLGAIIELKQVKSSYKN